ncbi:MAG: DUF4224 domain-containing protein [Gammaproteobacteria bacterium]
MFLTKAELKELTGYKYKSLQAKWLLSHGYKFDIAASGTPIVLKSHVEDILRGNRIKHKLTAEANFSNATLFG